MVGIFSIFRWLLIFFKNIISGITSVSTVWIQIKPNLLIWVQIICKDYQQVTLTGKSITAQGHEKIQLFYMFLRFYNFKNNINDQCQTVWIQIIKPNILIWVQIICKDYQQMSLTVIVKLLFLRFYNYTDQTVLSRTCSQTQKWCSLTMRLI